MIVPETYRLVGRPASLDLAIDTVDAEQLRGVIEWDYFPQMEAKYDEQACATMAGVSFGPSALQFEESACAFAGVRLAYGADNYWSLAVLISKYHLDGTRNQKKSLYRMVVLGDKLVEAYKSVRVVRDVGAVSIASLIDGDAMPLQRMVYERPITKQDIDTITGTLQATMRRANALGRKKDPNI
jgi:hypothetical protein